MRELGYGGRRAQHRNVVRGAASCALGVVALLGSTGPVHAQKDYYNTDRNRPVRVEDAYTTERYALELKIAPLRLERESGGLYHWGFDPEVAFGILPRTSIEFGLPVAIIDGGEAGGRRAGIAGLELSAFHNLNVETRGLPALGIRADVSLPVGSLAGSRTYPSLTGIATRTYSWARFHVNGQYTFGSAPDSEEDVGVHEASRWLAGLAVDRVFPLHAMLLIGEVYATQPLHDEEDIAWHAGAGVRYQVSPYLAFDAGVGTRLSGERSWYVTFGSAYHVGIRALMPRLR
jgi:hypothetical protein